MAAGTLAWETINIHWAHLGVCTGCWLGNLLGVSSWKGSCQWLGQCSILQTILSSDPEGSRKKDS